MFKTIPYTKLYIRSLKVPSTSLLKEIANDLLAMYDTGLYELPPIH